MYPPLVPCSQDPDAWFGYDGVAVPHGRRTVKQQEAVDHAKELCIDVCPLTERRRCAREALEHGERIGIWAGVELPGRKLLASVRKVKLAAAREELEVIAHQ
jgi:WhiB family transcriptional regulator, redox-sensing transcriptional regulator